MRSNRAGWMPSGDRPDCALRFRVDDLPVTFEDRVVGTVTEDVRESVAFPHSSP